MKRIFFFLIFTLANLSLFAESKLLKFGKELKKETKIIIDSLAEAGDRLNHQNDYTPPPLPKVERDYFFYTGSDKNNIVVNGFHYSNKDNTLEYYVPVYTKFKNGNTTSEFTLETDSTNLFRRKSVLIAFLKNNKWYVGQLYMTNSSNNQPSMYMLEVNSRDEAITILVEMFTVHAYAYVNYKQLGFQNTERIEENIRYFDYNNVDWTTKYTFESTVPEEMTRFWGFSYCNALVKVTKYNKLDGVLYSPYDYYMKHPLSLDECMSCTAAGLYKYVISPLGAHINTMTYLDSTFKKLDIVDTSSKWKLEIRNQ